MDIFGKNWNDILVNASILRLSAKTSNDTAITVPIELFNDLLSIVDAAAKVNISLSSKSLIATTSQDNNVNTVIDLAGYTKVEGNGSTILESLKSALRAADQKINEMLL